MKLVDLYKQTPAERHGDIKVAADRVFVKDTDGNIDEYLVSDGELWLARSNKELKQDVRAIKSKLGI
ncbi:MAG: hypothetical protein FJ025_00080 [Chloroflexi bacterium]|nr:hypothetical protein [Chloroflexota bacterium]